ncbi:MAG: F0F1 ATP synthase subunit A [Candidatus Aminicenantia bacterium]
MEELEHTLFIVDLFNKIFSPPLVFLLKLVGIKVADPSKLIPAHIVISLIVMVFLILFLGLASRKLKLLPSNLQQILEILVEGFESLLVDIIGEEGKKYLPLIGTLGLFIFFCNISGLIPGFMSPTSTLNVTVGCAVVAFIYYHWQGIKTHGVLGYLKHFMGPIPWLAPLLLPIELISHFSRPLSLSIRLFGNIFGEELLILIIVSLIPFLVPLPFMVLAIFTALVQAFVFIVLTAIYIAGAVASEEH